MLPRFGSRCRNFEVHTVWRGNVDEFYLWIGNNLPPIGGVSFKAQKRLCFTGTGFDLIGADNQAWLNPTVLETDRNLSVGTAVHSPPSSPYR